MKEEKEYNKIFQNTSLFFVAVGLVFFFASFFQGAPVVAPRYAEADGCNVPAIGTVFYSDSSTYILSGYTIPAARYCGYNTTDGNWCTPDNFPGISSDQKQTLQVGGGDGYRYSGAVNDGRTSMQCSWDFKVTNMPPYACNVTNGVFNYPYTYPASTFPPGTYSITYPGGSGTYTYAYPGYSQGATVLDVGHYYGSGPGCSWDFIIYNPPPVLTPGSSMTPNGATIQRSEDYALDVRADRAIGQVSGVNTWGGGTYYNDMLKGDAALVGDFNCSDFSCYGNTQWGPTGRQWGGGGLDGTYFTGAPSGHYDMNMYMKSDGGWGLWSGPYHYFFDIVPPSYTHYTVGSWSACSGYNTETGLGGTQTRTVTSYTNATSPNDSAPASSQSCSVPTYTHYNVSAWTACAGYNLNTGQNGTETRTVSSYINTTSPNDSAPASSQSCSMPADFNFLSAPPGEPGSGTLGNTYSTFVTFVGGQQSALSAPVSIAVNPTFPDYPNPPSLTFSVTNVSPSLPAGVSYTFTPNPLSAGQYSQGASFVANVPVTDSGLYTLTIEASGGGIVKQATVYLNVNTVNPSFIEI